MIADKNCLIQYMYTYCVPSTVVTSGSQSDSQQIFTEYFTCARQCASVQNYSGKQNKCDLRLMGLKIKQWSVTLQRMDGNCLTVGISPIGCFNPSAWHKQLLCIS